MKKYEKPILIEYKIELEDIVAASLDQNQTNSGITESIKDFFGTEE